MRMRMVAGALLAPLIFACSSDSDIRNSNIPGPHSHFALPRYKSRTDWEARKNHLRNQILSAAGLLPMPRKTPLHPSVVRHIDRGDYSIDVVVIETLPGYYLGGNLYRPKP